MPMREDRHYLNSLAEELAEEQEPRPAGMYDVRNDGGRVQDGTSYFHGIWRDSRFTGE